MKNRPMTDAEWAREPCGGVLQSLEALAEHVLRTPMTTVHGVDGDEIDGHVSRGRGDVLFTVDAAIVREGANAAWEAMAPRLARHFGISLGMAEGKAAAFACLCRQMLAEAGLPRGAVAAA